MATEFWHRTNPRADSRGLQFEYEDSKCTVTDPDANPKQPTPIKSLAQAKNGLVFRHQPTATPARQ